MLCAAQKTICENLIKAFDKKLKKISYNFWSKFRHVDRDDIYQYLCCVIVQLVDRVSPRYPNYDLPVGIVNQELKFLMSDFAREFLKVQYSEQCYDFASYEYSEEYPENNRILHKLDAPGFVAQQARIYEAELCSMMGQTESEILKLRIEGHSFASIKRQKFIGMSDDCFYDKVKTVKLSVIEFFYGKEQVDDLFPKFSRSPRTTKEADKPESIEAEIEAAA